MTLVRRNYVRLEMIILMKDPDGVLLGEWVLRGKDNAMIKRAVTEYLFCTGLISTSFIRPVSIFREGGGTIIRCVFHPDCEEYEYRLEELRKFKNVTDLDVSVNVPSSQVYSGMSKIYNSLCSDRRDEYRIIEHLIEPVIVRYL